MKTEMTTQCSRQFSWLATVLLGLLIIQITGCSSVPEGSATMKQQALSFAPPSGKAGVYLIRPSQFVGGGALNKVDLDYEEFGVLDTSSYLYGIVTPGQHTLRGLGSGVELVPFTAEAGKNYYFTISTAFTHYVIAPIPETDGQAYVRKFKLSGENRFELQNPPGQTQ
jgi:hypothetical protein